MKKGIIKAGILLSLLCIIPLTSFAKNGKDEAEEKKNEAEEKKQEVEDFIKQLENEKADTEAYILALDQEMAALDESISAAEAEIAQTEADIVVKQQELEEAKIEEQTQYETMKARIKFMYENGDTAYIDALLQSEDLSDLLNRAEYISKISEYDYNMLQNLIDIREEIANQETMLQFALDGLETQKADLELEKESLDMLVAAKAQEVLNYENSIAESEELAKQYEEEIRLQESIIAQIEEQERLAQSNNSSSIIVGVGAFLWPTPGNYRITSYFGARDGAAIGHGASSNHKGIDICGPTPGSIYGADIVASASGTVVASAYNYAMGNYVMISHGNGVYTIYMHASKLCTTTGAYVTQGTKIAEVGSTGNSSGPHLHFGIRVNGAYVDPMQYFN
ncbi:MAG: peptidoglycan DD-metalloendopeptidase family protein [Lachnospiraceae bacterium]|nr:peptidoglycan DD-metalloendopeptidase family protein [Lachnospiraceae bacterium]